MTWSVTVNPAAPAISSSSACRGQAGRSTMALQPLQIM